MGVTSSVANSKIKTTNEIISSIKSKNSNRCSSSSANSQIMKFGKIISKGCQVNLSDIKQNMNLKTDFSCKVSQINNKENKAAFDNAIDTTVDAVTNGGFGVSTTVVNQLKETANRLKESSEFENNSTCEEKRVNDQIMTTDDIILECTDAQIAAGLGVINISNFEQKLLSDAKIKCETDQKNSNSLMAKFDNLVKEATKIETSGFLSDLISNWVLILIVAFCIMAAAGILYYLYKNKQENSNNEEFQNVYNVDESPPNNSNAMDGKWRRKRFSKKNKK